MIAAGARKDVIAGAFFVAVGGVAATLALRYGLGSIGSMGAGFFPFCLGVLAIVLGLISVVHGVVDTAAEPIDGHGLLPLVLILSGVLAFALLVERAGLVAAIFGLLAFACAPTARTRPLEVLLTFAALALFSVGLFVYAFGMPLRAF